MCIFSLLLSLALSCPRYSSVIGQYKFMLVPSLSLPVFVYLCVHSILVLFERDEKKKIKLMKLFQRMYICAFFCQSVWTSSIADQLCEQGFAMFYWLHVSRHKRIMMNHQKRMWVRSNTRSIVRISMNFLRFSDCGRRGRRYFHGLLVEVLSEWFDCDHHLWKWTSMRERKWADRKLYGSRSEVDWELSNSMEWNMRLADRLFTRRICTWNDLLMN